MTEENRHCHCDERLEKLETAVAGLRDSIRILNRNVLCVLNIAERAPADTDFPSMPLQNEAAFVEFEELLDSNRSIVLKFVSSYCIYSV
jgi:hypothetical protein